MIDLFDPGMSFFFGEQRRLVCVPAYSDHQLIEQRKGTMNDVDMPDRDGIEGSWKQGDSFHEPKFMIERSPIVPKVGKVPPCAQPIHFQPAEEL